MKFDNFSVHLTEKAKLLIFDLLRRDLSIYFLKLMGIIQLFSERVFYQGKVCTNAFHLSSIFKLFVV